MPCSAQFKPPPPPAPTHPPTIFACARQVNQRQRGLDPVQSPDPQERWSEVDAEVELLLLKMLFLRRLQAHESGGWRVSARGPVACARRGQSGLLGRTSRARE